MVVGTHLDFIVVEHKVTCTRDYVFKFVTVAAVSLLSSYPSTWWLTSYIFMYSSMH